ncbi:hypothetical protein DL96DRAFT_1558604 [Flagelloscypha sp. PMI_526]|nr:hypothetical protein DL96DRAFT_1558604 [Flagelloscypha sp. PMI_526]
MVPITSTIEVDLPLDLPFADLAPRIRPHVDLASVSKISPVVTDGPSNYNPATSGGLKNRLSSWYKAYRRTVGLAPQERSSSESEVKSSWTRAFKKDGPMVDWQDFSITVGAATLRFNRTLRVPDDATNYALPPGLGTFPLAKAQDFSSTLPEYIVQRGGYIMVIITFYLVLQFPTKTGTCAIKVSVGGINAISGYQQTGGSETGIQDYVVGGKQPWLDGIATESGVVRQFVAMKLGQGYTIEEQLSNTANGGIQIDRYSDYDVQKEDQLHLTLLRDMKIFIKSASEKTFSILVDMSDTIDIVMLKIQDVNGCRPSEQSLWFDREYLREGRTINGHPTLPDPRMGIAAGGKIVQKIYRDTNSPLVYDEDDVSRVFIHAVSTAAWEMITGVVCPLTSITPALYKAHDYPWFALYDEHLSTVQPSGRFDNIQSVLKMDYVASNEPINPEFPPDCAHHMGRTSTCIARPCGHPACVECFGAAIFSGWKCPECSSKISQHVGFDRPVPKVSNSGDNSKGSWWEAENQIQGVSRGNGKVVTLMLEEDRISGLHASDSLAFLMFISTFKGSELSSPVTALPIHAYRV